MNPFSIFTRRALNTLAAASFVGVVVLTGCGGGDGGPSTPQATPTMQAPFEVTSAPEKTSYAPGEIVRVTLTARNRTNVEQVFFSPNTEAFASSIMRAGSLRAVYQFPAITLPTVTENRVAAGASLTRTYQWDQTTPRSTKVARGKYFIRTTLQRLSNTPTPTPSPSASPTVQATPEATPTVNPTANPTGGGFGGDANISATPVAIILTD